MSIHEFMPDPSRRCDGGEMCHATVHIPGCRSQAGESMPQYTTKEL